MWCLTVLVESALTAAISLLVRPVADNERIFSSRLVNVDSEIALFWLTFLALYNRL